ncbi:PEP/pyruvate-binding domain-containing protein [Halobium salinum]|uniref:PEP/pyruvate-binding domain-containing protein n=1 Tax=Halobium salinum TaxID=1364940 RepID=A0ABD5PB61_9EURY|nr:PEP/pyruvate-binding domain-containing protein [Halobium salinum]
MTSDQQFALTLDDADATDLALTGGKGSALARLVGAGLPVPGGVVVTTAATSALFDVAGDDFEAALDRLDAVDPADTTALADAAETVRAVIRAADLPPATVRTVDEALAGLAADTDDADTTFAVRSSATAEDLPEASFAGQHETYLHVPRDAVVGRVRDCAASLFTDRAVAYRARNGVSNRDVAMAVVVQPTVDADAAGVLFTADPVTGNRRVATVDATFGLGEALVAGETTPDSARVDRDSGAVLDYEVGEKAVVTRARSTAADAAAPAGTGGTETVPLSSDRRGERVLSDQQLRTLVDLGERAEALFDTPQDVEWALVDGTFLLLQSRPVASLFPVPTPEPTDDRLHVYVSVGHMQAFPEAMPPLVRDVWLRYVEAEAPAFGMESFWTTPAVEAGERVYFDLTPVLRLKTAREDLPDSFANINEPAAEGLRDLLARRGDEFAARPTLATVPALARMGWTVGSLSAAVVPRTLASVARTLVSPPDPADVEAWFVTYGRLEADRVRGMETPEARARAAFASLDIPEILTELYPRIAPLFVAFALGGWLKRRFPDEAEDVNAVGRGFPEELVTRINLGLGDLADVARDHPAVADALRSRATLDDLESTDGGDAFLAALDAYLDEFGHRATGEIDVSRPRWCEDPSGLLGAVRANLAGNESGAHRDRLHRLERQAEAAARRLESRADIGPLGPLRRRVVRHVVRIYRGTVLVREYPKQGVAHLFAAWHDVLADAGESLARAGRLDDPDDVWFLRREELLAALDGDADGGSDDGDAAELRPRIEARRRTFERFRTVDAPPLLTSEGEAPRPPVDSDLPAGTLVGTGVSVGVVEGVARVVRDPRVATVQPGEVLVAPSTDPGWTPLFLNAAALVSEVGGPVSHGALVAREYGLPAVVSVRGATHSIRTGQRVRVDGARGTVEVLDDGVAGDGRSAAPGRDSDSDERADPDRDAETTPA